MTIGKKLANNRRENVRILICFRYEWEGKINEDSELILMIKTSSEKVPELSKYVRENHPYDCAEVISSKIDDGNEPYLKWISDTLSSPISKNTESDGNPEEKKQKLDE
ncbi:protein CutA homolog [Ruditapes philippinarum]|uniref:protein CutA homolog n=1 Tax=Ruditapes philippinarum TaxID=129788 RepID=UPI00295A89E5|nr:protein CutA homolog [Ruditapes philippinarum]